MSGHIIPKDAPRIEVPTRLSKPHKLVKDLAEAAKPLPKNADGWPTYRREGMRPLEVSKQSLPRCLRIMQALVSESLRRGYEVKASSPARSNNLAFVAIVVKRYSHDVFMKQRGETLEILLPNEWGGQRRWADGKRARLEDKLGLVLQNIEQRADADEQRDAERAREEAERERQRGQAVANAREFFHEDARAAALTRQVSDWKLAGDIRALTSWARTAESPDMAWLAWADSYADRLSEKSITQPEIPEPKAEDLRPYLNFDPWGYLS